MYISKNLIGMCFHQNARELTHDLLIFKKYANIIANLLSLKFILKISQLLVIRQ